MIAIPTLPVLRRAAVAACGAVLFAAPLSARQDAAFVGATVWDGTGAPPSGPTTVVVRSGRIERISPAPPPGDLPVVDVGGRWIVPGLVESHAHVSGRWAPAGVEGDAARLRAELLLFARYGVTTVNSLGDEPVEAARALRAEQDGAPPGRARLHFAGPVVTADTYAGARAAAAAAAAAGGEWLKIRVDDNLGTTTKMPWEAVRGVMEEATAHGLRVATHVFYLDDARALLRLGSDLVAHSVRDTDVDGAFIQLLRDRRVCYVPTLTREVSTFVYASRPDFLDDPFFRRWADPGEVARVSDPAFQADMAASPAARRYAAALVQAQRNLARLAHAGIPVAFGTDAGPPARFPGYFEHMELELMVEAGLSPEEALRSATGVAASCLDLDDVGVLVPERWADFLVLRDDPLQNVRALRTLEAVYVGGREVR